MCMKNPSVTRDALAGNVAQRYAPPTDSNPPSAEGTQIPQNKSSARRRLWDLDGHAACPITGVCLRLSELKKMAHKAGLDVAGQTEYELHIAVVSECRHRSPLAELVQRELDARYDLFVLKSQRLKTTEALAQWWDQCCMGMDWAGVFWALLTHPRCSRELEFIVLGQVHMLQHQVGMAARVDQTQLRSLIQDNQKIGDELVQMQQRLATAMLGIAQIKAQHEADLSALRAELIRTQAALEHAETQLASERLQWPDLAQRKKLREVNRHLEESNQILRRALNLANQASLNKATPLCPIRASAQTAVQKEDSTHTFDASISDRAVLCVGGRARGIPIYRELVEDKGARFLHHDGGEEDAAGQLGPMLHAADLVICQVGCISHNAYWRVKEHCKRHDKPCLFVETPSRSAMKRALNGYAQPLATDTSGSLGATAPFGD